MVAGDHTNWCDRVATNVVVSNDLNTGNAVAWEHVAITKGMDVVIVFCNSVCIACALQKSELNIIDVNPVLKLGKVGRPEGTKHKANGVGTS